MAVLSAASDQVSLCERPDDEAVEADGEAAPLGAVASVAAAPVGVGALDALLSSRRLSAAASAASMRRTCGAISAPRRCATTPPSSAHDATR